MNHLPHVMMQMGRTAQKEIEAVARIFLANRGVWLGPIFFGLSRKSPQHCSDRVVKTIHYGSFRRATCFRKFPVAIADVPSAGNLRSDVVVQIAGEMKHKVSETVSERKRLAPELLIR
jgi:hypothetical protein